MERLEKFFPLILATLVAVSYSNSLGCGLVFDDLAAIRDNRDVRPNTPWTNMFFNDYWGTSLRKEQSHKSYRPLTVLTFRLNYAVHGLVPFGYHLVNMILHFIVSYIFYKFCLHFLSKPCSGVASAIFVVHPIHTEAVTSVVGRAELLAALAFLGALIFYISDWHHLPSMKVWQQCILTSLIAASGMLCKEQAITVLAICVIYEFGNLKGSSHYQNVKFLLFGKRVSIRWSKSSCLRIILLIIPFVTILSFRWKIMDAQLPVFSRFDNPAAVAPTPSRQLTYNYLLSVNARLLLFPVDLCCDWTGSTIPLVKGFNDMRNMHTLLLYLSIFSILKAITRTSEQRRPILMSISILVVPFIPATNLFFPVGFVVAERVLYIPSMGICMLVAQGWGTLWDKRSCKLLAIVGLSVLVIFHVLKTAKRNVDWQSEHSLYSSALDINDQNAKLHNSMGKVLENLNQKEKAMSHYKVAIQLQLDDIRGYLNLGRVLTSLNKYTEAEEIYIQAKKLLPQPGTSLHSVHLTPSHLQLFLNLAFLISQNDSRLEEADALYCQAILLRSDFTNAYLNRGDILLKMNRTKEAEAMYNRALQFDDNSPDLYFNLGIILMDQGRNSEALELFTKALNIDPDHKAIAGYVYCFCLVMKVLLTEYNLLFQKQNIKDSLLFSAALIQELKTFNPKDTDDSRLHMISSKREESEQAYLNLGLMSLDNKDFISAERWFKKAFAMKPDSRSALFNLALLLSNQQRLKEAVIFLKKLLQIYPSHVNGLILMADIDINYFGNLDSAEECYHKVLELEPRNEKALHNLCVISVERGDLYHAEKCFLDVATVYPSDYVLEHLANVRMYLNKQQVNDMKSTAETDPPLLSVAAHPSTIS